MLTIGAEVFHPWVRWEGPGSGFENSSGAGGGAAGGVWKSKWVGPSWAQVGGPKLGPRGWAQAGPKWVGPGYTDLAPLGLRSKNKVFERHGLQQVNSFCDKNLKLGSSIIFFEIYFPYMSNNCESDWMRRSAFWKKLGFLDQRLGFL